MYQAVPIFIEEPETVDQQKREVKPEVKFLEPPPVKSEISEKTSLERKEFLESMLKSSTSSSSVATDHQTNIELEELRRAKEEEEHRLKQEMRKRAHEKHTEELKYKEQELVQKQEKVVQRDHHQVNGIHSHSDEVDLKSSSTKTQTDITKLSQKVVRDNASAEARARYCLPQSGPAPRVKLYPFEAPQKEQGFSISGMWSNVNLGLVKERSTFWQKRGKKGKNGLNNRRSRVIDPNEWVGGNPPAAVTQHEVDVTSSNFNELQKNKFLSSGNLVNMST